MKNLRALSLAFCIISVSHSSSASVFSELSAEDQASIQKGDMVTLFSPNSDPETTWPKSDAYKRIEATPEEAAAVFTDFDKQKDYIKNLKQSHISQQLSPSSCIVDYQIRVPFYVAPFLKDTRYSAQNDLAFDSSTNTYTIKWTLVKAGFLSKISGQATFEALGTGTLIAYENEMTPSSKGMNHNAVVKEIKKGSQEAVQDIINRITNERQNEQPLLQEQIIQLRKAFAKN